MKIQTVDGDKRSGVAILFQLIMASFLLAISGFVQANVYDDPVIHVPAFPLLDEDGISVLDSGKPYSSKQSCGGCHDYDKITHSYHFEAGRDEASDDFGSKRGLSQLVSPGYFGGYNCMGSNNPDSLSKKANSSAHDFGDKGSAGLIMRCESCHAGGGWMEKDRDGNRYDETDPASVTQFDGDYFNRGTDENNHPADLSVVSQWDWKKSGVVENDCLKCHADLNNLIVPDGVVVTARSGDGVGMADTVRRSVLIDEGHFRESNTAILEVLNMNISGDESQDKTLMTFERADMATVDHMGVEEPADGEITDVEVVFADDGNGDMLPQLNWNEAAFTDEGKVEMPMIRFPANDNCMDCHSTSNSRRGFYGFGEGAEATFDEDDGTIIEDYEDDVHKGKTWREDNGQERTIENCNVCHSRNYFNPISSNADVDASHDFLKGSSDMDVHNDRDFSPNAKSCEYCHEQSPQAAELANPSGDADMLSAHEKLWRLSGDMSGQPAAEVEKITQVHLDVVSCQACHITDKKARGRAFEPMFRYREAENGNQTIVPYKPKPRYFWKDNNTGTVLNKTQRDSIYEAEYDSESGDLTGGKIIDPETGATLAEVTARISHGSVRFGDPESYEAFVALKNAYDKVFQLSGIDNSNAVLVWSEINQYLISHNTRPAVSSVQCEECHNYKQDGTTISAFVSNDGVFGENNSYEITTVLDPRLVTEGIIVFDYPYMIMDAESGVVMANVSDILAYSTVDPSMTALRAATANIATAAAQTHSTVELIEQALAASGITLTEDAAQLAERFSNSNAYLFQSRQGDSSIRDVTVISGDESFVGYSLQVAIADDTVATQAAAAELGSLVAGAEVFSLQINMPSGGELSSFTFPLLVKLPYSGSSNDAEELNIITSSDGEAWSAITPSDILMVRAETEDRDGYIVFQTTHFSYFTVTDDTAADTDSTTADNNGSSFSGGSSGSMSLMLLIFGFLSLLFNRASGSRSVRD